MPIKHPALYEAVHARMQHVVKHVESWNPRGRTRVFRCGDAADAGRAGADKYRTVFRSSINDNYRWTGPRPPSMKAASPAVGGVYTSLGLNDALLGEVAFYAFHTTLDQDVRRTLDGGPPVLTAANFPPKLATKRIFEYEFPLALRIADLSLTGRAGRDLLRAVAAGPTVRAALARAGYHDARLAYLATDDHSLPRAMAQGIRDFMPGWRGIKVTSVRAEAALQLHEEEGDNVVFFGPDGALLGELRPVREIAFDLQANGRLKDRVGAL